MASLTSKRVGAGAGLRIHDWRIQPTSVRQNTSENRGGHGGKEGGRHGKRHERLSERRAGVYGHRAQRHNRDMPRDRTQGEGQRGTVIRATYRRTAVTGQRSRRAMSPLSADWVLPGLDADTRKSPRGDFRRQPHPSSAICGLASPRQQRQLSRSQRARGRHLDEISRSGKSPPQRQDSRRSRRR